MTESRVAVTREEGGIAIMSLARPPVNALDLPLLREIRKVAEELAADLSVKGVILTGQGKAFCAGLDLKAVPGYSEEQLLEVATAIGLMIEALYQAPYPLVAAIQGHAIAGGCVLPLTADVRVASVDARFGLTEIQVGLPFPPPAMAFLQAEVSQSALRRMVLQADQFDATEAASLGLLDKVVPAQEVMDVAMMYAQRLAAHPRETYGYTKRQMRAKTLSELQAQLERDVMKAWLASFLRQQNA